MRKVIAALNMTLDGIFDHAAGVPDEDLHKHYTDLLNRGDVILYGRITFELMEYWRQFLENPTGEKAFDDFAVAIDRIPKIIFSKSLKGTDWKSATISNIDLQETVLKLKQQSGGNIYVGSRSLIIQLMKLNLIDEYQFCIHPALAGFGINLFENLNQRIMLNLIKSKTFKGGSIILYYYPKNSEL